MLCLAKYGRFAPRLKAAKAFFIAPVFATYFTPSGARKGHREREYESRFFRRRFQKMDITSSEAWSFVQDHRDEG